jgi:two-component system alkaline phosphatase synthesis response regulator PhoP
VKVLLVEDDAKQARFLTRVLQEESFAVEACGSGAAALAALGAMRPDVVVLDWMLPDGDGLEVCREARRRSLDVPILMLTARGEVADRVSGLQSGADDYLAKPFGLQELLARIEALLRRTRGDQPIRFGQITVDPATRRVTRNGHPVELSRKELDILLFLARHRNHTVSRDQILDAAWGLADAGSERAVDYHILHLRRKLEPNPTNPQHLITHHGIGYELRDEAPDQ